MGLPAATVTVTLEDVDSQRTTRSFEARSAAVTDAQAQGIADDLQALTQLEVVDVTISRRVTGFTPITAEANSSVAETASVRVPIKTVAGADGGYHSFNLPALKAAFKSGKNVVGNAAAMLTFLNNFDNADGVAASDGLFFVSDGEEISELDLEGASPKVEGKVNR